MMRRHFLQTRVVQGQERPPLQLPYKNRDPDTPDTDGRYNIHPTEPAHVGIPGWSRQDRPEKIHQLHEKQNQGDSGYGTHVPLDAPLQEQQERQSKEENEDRQSHPDPTMRETA